MRISVTEAKAQLTELVRRAEAGEEVILTRHGQPAARLDRQALHRLIEEIQASAATKMTPGEPAARSQDFLYDENGLPR
jgi:antitoxin (DNA-binding transcriptional repressor) of toxin-antitoxin stability system